MDISKLVVPTTPSIDVNARVDDATDGMDVKELYRLQKMVEQKLKDERRKIAISNGTDLKVSQSDWYELVGAALIRTDLKATDLLNGLAAKHNNSNEWVKKVRKRAVYPFEVQHVLGAMEYWEDKYKSIYSLLRTAGTLDLSEIRNSNSVAQLLNTIRNQMEDAMKISELRIQNAELMEENAQLKAEKATPLDWKTKALELKAEGKTIKEIAEATGKGSATIQRHLAKQSKSED